MSGRCPHPAAPLRRHPLPSLGEGIHFQRASAIRPLLETPTLSQTWERVASLSEPGEGLAGEGLAGEGLAGEAVA
jgi:hypothetical protein